MKKEVKIEWTETQWCSNTVEVEVPDDIPADEANQWIEDNIWDFYPYDGMSVDYVEMVEDSVEIEVCE